MKPDYVDINPKTGMVEHIKWPCSACAFLLAVRSCPLCGRRLCKDCLITHLCRGKGYFRGNYFRGKRR